MKRARLVVLLGLLGLLGLAAPAYAEPARPITDAEIRRLLAVRIDTQRQATGAVVGIVTPSGARVIAYGTRGVTDRRPVNGDTVFDIGSITKVFTSLLLADMAQRGELALDDPAARHVADRAIKLSDRAGRPITLVELATHTAGLPLRPDNLVSKDPDNKYAGYTIAHLFAFLSSYVPAHDAARGYAYSNVGYGLLGEVLSRRLGQRYADAIRTRITEPLGLRDTRIVPTAAMAARAAIGHDLALKPAPHWRMGALDAAGALRSTANDLLKLLAAYLGERKTGLGPAMAVTLATRRPGGMQPAQQIALGWNIYRDGEREIAWKNGSVGGFRAFIGLDLEARIGVVALANAQTGTGVDDIGLHLLDPELPVDLHVPRVHREITLPPEVLDRYVGRYQFAPDDIVTITRDGTRLYAELLGQDKIEVFAEAEREVFVKVVDAQVTFIATGTGRATAAIWHQAGQDLRGERIE